MSVILYQSKSYKEDSDFYKKSYEIKLGRGPGTWSGTRYLVMHVPFVDLPSTKAGKGSSYLGHISLYLEMYGTESSCIEITCLSALYRI